MKCLILAIFVLLMGISAFSMDMPMVDVGKKRPASEIEELERAPVPKEECIAKTSLLQEFSPEIKEKIRNFLTTAPGFGIEKLYNIAKNIRSQRLVSKEDRDRLDDPAFVEALITDLAARFTNYNRTKVALVLHTKSAADWLNNALIQEAREIPPNFRRLDKEVTIELIEQLNQRHLDAARFLLNAAKLPGQNQYLLQFNSATPINRETLLLAAAGAGDLSLFNIILPHSLPVINHINENDQTALLRAISYDNVSIALVLLRAGASPFIIRGGIVEDSALLHAAEKNQTEVVEELLKDPQVQIQVNFITDVITFTPLYFAIRNNNYPMFRMLLNLANVDLTTEAGNLLYEALVQNTQMVANLVARDIDVNAETTWEDEDAELYAPFGVFELSASNGSPVVSDMDTRERLSLLLPKLNLELKGRSGNTLLIKAVRQAKAKTIERLLEAGARVDATNDQGHSALYYAEQLTTGNKDLIVKMLQNAAAKQGAVK